MTTSKDLLSMVERLIGLYDLHLKHMTYMQASIIAIEQARHRQEHLFEIRDRLLVKIGVGNLPN